MIHISHPPLSIAIDNSLKKMLLILRKMSRLMIKILPKFTRLLIVVLTIPEFVEPQEFHLHRRQKKINLLIVINMLNEGNIHTKFKLYFFICYFFFLFGVFSLYYFFMHVDGAYAIFVRLSFL